MNFFITILLTMLVFLPSSLLAQMKEIKQVKIELKNSRTADYELIKAGKTIVAIGEDYNTKNNKKAYYIQTFDSLLQEKIQKHWELNRKFSWVAYDTYHENLFLLTKHITKSQLFNVLKLNTLTGEMNTYPITSPTSITLNDIYVLKNNLFVWGKIQDIPVIFHFDLETKKLLSLPKISDKNIVIEDVIVDKIGNHFTVIKRNKKDDQLIILGYDLTGDLLTENHIDSKKKILAIKTFYRNDKMYIAGTYAQHKKQFTQGVFFGSISKNKGTKVKYVSLFSLKNFFVYLSPKQQKRFKKRHANRNLLGKKMRFGVRVKLTNLTYQHNNFHLLAECYQLKYNKSNNYRNNGLRYGQRYLNPSNYPNAYSQRTTETYLYTHAFSFSFDENLKIINDFSLQLKNLEELKAERHVYLDADSNKIQLFRVLDDKILFRKDPLKREKIEDEKKETLTEKNQEKEYAMPTQMRTQNGFFHWYEDYYIRYGIEKGQKNEKQGILTIAKILAD